MKILIIENEQNGELIKNALQQYVDQVNASEDHTDDSGAVISIARDLPVIEDAISQIEHSTDTVPEEVLYSAFEKEVGQDDTIEIVRSKVTDEVLLERIDDSKIIGYYDENLAPTSSQSNTEE